MQSDERYNQPAHEALVELKADFDKYGSLPEALFKYVVEAIRKQKTRDRFLRELFGERRHALLSELDARFDRAAQRSSLGPDTLLRALDFRPRDVAEGRFEAFIAELRAMAGLYWFGMNEVKPLKAGSERGADMVATSELHRYAVEVFHKEWILNDPAFVFQTFYTAVAADKKGQLESTASTHRCDKKALVCVLDGNYFALSTRAQIISRLRDVSESLNWGEDWHFCAITGMVSINGEPDDSVYPDFV